MKALTMSQLEFASAGTADLGKLEIYAGTQYAEISGTVGGDGEDSGDDSADGGSGATDSGGTFVITPAENCVYDTGTQCAMNICSPSNPGVLMNAVPAGYYSR